ncbi:hypothetical protein HU200_016543 [Digitaria exilis]|uniref:Uncharacterized protein n=1 Tax=Digitaria exilis TaxID=1010633 RepID=A0A835F7Z1_9POAL|nr:hypothetical protein HU200_016543 [Digitaria exilis]
MRWVAEGYSRDTKDNTAEERAEKLFSMLVNLRKCPPSTRRTGRHLVIQSDWDRDMIVYDSIDFSKLRPRQLGVEVPAGIDKLTALHTLGIVNIATVPHKATSKSSRYSHNCASLECQVSEEKLQGARGDQPSCGDISSPSKDLKTLKLYGLVDFVPLWIKDLPKLTKLELEMTISDKWVDQSGIIGILGDMKELTVLRLSVKPHQDGEGNKLDFCVLVEWNTELLLFKG